MTTKNIQNAASVTTAQSEMVDAIMDWIDGLSPFADNLEISITLNEEELKADLNHGRNG